MKLIMETNPEKMIMEAREPTYQTTHSQLLLSRWVHTCICIIFSITYLIMELLIPMFLKGNISKIEYNQREYNTKFKVE